MPKSFVFLEFTDPDLNALVSGIRETATGNAPTTNVHITVRGPYSTPIRPEQLRRYHRTLARDPILLDGYGLFRVDKRFIVYVKVQHPKLRQVWWKPDFPISRYGFNPHVTLYEGPDSDRAHALLTFLQQESVKYVTWDFCVTAYVSDHRDLFASPHPLQRHFLKLSRLGTVKPNFLATLDRALKQATRAA